MIGNYLKSNIKHLRRHHGFTQQELSDKILCSSRSALAAWEEGRASPSIDSLLTLSKFFDYSIDDLIKKDLTGVQIMPINKEVSLEYMIDVLIDKYQIQYETVMELSLKLEGHEQSKGEAVCRFIKGFSNDLKNLKNETIPKTAKAR